MTSKHINKKIVTIIIALTVILSSLGVGLWYLNDISKDAKPAQAAAPAVINPTTDPEKYLTKADLDGFISMQCGRYQPFNTARNLMLQSCAFTMPEAKDQQETLKKKIVNSALSNLRMFVGDNLYNVAVSNTANAFTSCNFRRNRLECVPAAYSQYSNIRLRGYQPIYFQINGKVIKSKFKIYISDTRYAGPEPEQIDRFKPYLGCGVGADNVTLNCNSNCNYCENFPPYFNFNQTNIKIRQLGSLVSANCNFRRTSDRDDLICDPLPLQQNIDYALGHDFIVITSDQRSEPESIGQTSLGDINAIDNDVLFNGLSYGPNLSVVDTENAVAIPDSDSDNINDRLEDMLGINKNSKDTDNDGLDDYPEFEYGFNPLSYDSDDDGLGDKTDSDIPLGARNPWINDKSTNFENLTKTSSKTAIVAQDLQTTKVYCGSMATGDARAKYNNSYNYTWNGQISDSIWAGKTTKCIFRIPYDKQFIYDPNTKIISGLSLNVGNNNADNDPNNCRYYTNGIYNPGETTCLRTQTCIFEESNSIGNFATCFNVPVGSLPGDQKVFITLNGNTVETPRLNKVFDLTTGTTSSSNDSDGDGITNTQEDTLGTIKYNPDSDFDGFNDKQEIDAGSDPMDAYNQPGQIPLNYFFRNVVQPSLDCNENREVSSTGTFSCSFPIYNNTGTNLIVDPTNPLRVYLTDENYDFSVSFPKNQPSKNIPTATTNFSDPCNLNTDKTILTCNNINPIGLKDGKYYLTLKSSNDVGILSRGSLSTNFFSKGNVILHNSSNFVSSADLATQTSCDKTIATAGEKISCTATFPAGTTGSFKFSLGNTSAGCVANTTNTTCQIPVPKIFTEQLSQIIIKGGDGKEKVVSAVTLKPRYVTPADLGSVSLNCASYTNSNSCGANFSFNILASGQEDFITRNPNDPLRLYWADANDKVIPASQSQPCYSDEINVNGSTDLNCSYLKALEPEATPKKIFAKLDSQSTYTFLQSLIPPTSGMPDSNITAVNCLGNAGQTTISSSDYVNCAVKFVKPNDGSNALIAITSSPDIGNCYIELNNYIQLAGIGTCAFKPTKVQSNTPVTFKATTANYTEINAGSMTITPAPASSLSMNDFVSANCTPYISSDKKVDCSLSFRENNVCVRNDSTPFICPQPFAPNKSGSATFNLKDSSGVVVGSCVATIASTTADSTTCSATLSSVPSSNLVAATLTINNVDKNISTLKVIGSSSAGTTTLPLAISNLANGTCNPTSITVGQTTTCTFPITPISGTTFTAPTITITALVQGSTATPINCSADAGFNTLTCTNIPSTGVTVNSSTPIVLAQNNGSGTNIINSTKASVGLTSGSTGTGTTLTQTEIPTAIVAQCQSINFNSNSGCSFSLPSGKTIPTDMRLSIGNGPVSSQACTISGQNATCPSIPTPNSVGILKVYANTGGSKIDTGETVKIVGPSLSSITWGFTPDIGGTAPLFKSNTDVVVKLTNFKSVYETTILPNNFVCNLEYRLLNDQKSTTTTWTKISNNPVSYDPVNGCQFSITKAQRGNTLNQSLRLTVTKTNNGILSTNPEDINTFFGEYFYRFQGAGVAVGGV